MGCPCSDNNKLNNIKKLDYSKSLRLEDMENMSIDKIVDLYRDGYQLENSQYNIQNIDTTNTSLDTSHQNIKSMTASPSFAFVEATHDSPNMTFIALVYNSGTKGRIRLKVFDKTGGSCVEVPALQTDHCIEPGYNTYIQSGLYSLLYALKYSGPQFSDYGCLRAYVCPGDTNCTCTTYSTSAVAISDNIQIGWGLNITPTPVTNFTLTSGNGSLVGNWSEPDNTSIFAYWIYLTRVSDSAILAIGYIRNNSVNITNLTNGVQYSLRVVPFSFDYKQGGGVTMTATPSAPIPSNAQIFNACWGISGLGATCSIPPEEPVIPIGTNFTIKADVANSGSTGPVRAVFKANSATISDQNTSSLAPYPGGGFWSPTVSYTMPSQDVTLTIEGYGWTGTSWTLSPTNTYTVTISKSTPTCTGIDIDINTPTANVGDTITLTAFGITPNTQPYTVTFTDRSNAILGTCTSSNGMCSRDWDTTGLAAGTYYVKAAIIGQCTSTERAIGLSMPIVQYDVDIYVKDSVTTNPIQGANVTVGVQTLQTDSNGHVLFIVDLGTIYITISKTGYNTISSDPQSVYNNVTFNYDIVPVTPAPGNLRFVTSPPGISGAEVHFIGDSPTLKGTTDGNGYYTANGLAANRVVNYEVRKTGYNTATGSITVVGGITIDVIVSMTLSTPTTGDICVKSSPAEASIKIDGTLKPGKTTAISGVGGCVSANIIYGLTPVQHSYELNLTGFGPKSGNFTPVAGTTQDVDAGTLTPLPTLGTLNISSVPEGARIYIMSNGVYLDTGYVTGTSGSPTVITTLVAGAYSYKLTLIGYQDYINTLNITTGQTTVVNPTLIESAPTTGSLSIASYPAGAEIYIEIGGTFQDMLYITGPIGNPTIISNLEEGSYRYKLTYTDYPDATDNFTISAGEVTGPINVTMTRTSADSGAGMIFGLVGIAALGMMMSSKSATSYSPTGKVATRESPTRESPTRESPTRESPTRESPTRESPTRESPTR